MDLITLDFETYFDVRLSLSKMSTVQYVQDKEFKVWGVGEKLNDEPTLWVSETECRDFLNQIGKIRKLYATIHFLTRTY